jgi:hypothetical protein
LRRPTKIREKANRKKMEQLMHLERQFPTKRAETAAAHHIEEVDTSSKMKRRKTTSLRDSCKLMMTTRTEMTKTQEIYSSTSAMEKVRDKSLLGINNRKRRLKDSH